MKRENIIVTLAIIAGCLLFFLRIKKVSISYKKSGNLFVATLLVVLNMLNYSACADSAKTSKEVAADENKNKKIDRITVLNATKEWKNFKAFWKKLDYLPPRFKSDNTVRLRPDNVGSEIYETLMLSPRYARPINSNEAAVLRKEIQRLIKDLKKLKGQATIKPLELKLLEDICNARIELMSEAIVNDYPISQMELPSAPIIKQGSIKNLEDDIDFLTELKKQGKASKEKFRQADIAARSEFSKINPAVGEVITKSDFSKLDVDQDALFESLIKNDYLNTDGSLSVKFYGISNPYELRVDSIYKDKQKQIYDILAKHAILDGIRGAYIRIYRDIQSYFYAAYDRRSGIYLDGPIELIADLINHG